MSTETRWFTTKTGKVWHALTGGRAFCRANIHPHGDTFTTTQRALIGGDKCASCERKLAETDAAPATTPGPKKCGTVGCKSEVTHALAYTFPESRDQPETDTVCESCGEGYVRRPSLRASLTPIAIPGKIETWADGYGNWHASVPITDDSAEVARAAILAELDRRVSGYAGENMRVKRHHVTEWGTVVYAEVRPGEDDYDSTMADSTSPALDDTSRTVEIITVPVGWDVPWEVSNSLSEVALWLGNATEHDRQAIRHYARDIAAPGVALRITFPSVMTFIMDYAGNGRYRIYVPSDSAPDAL